MITAKTPFLPLLGTPKTKAKKSRAPKGPDPRQVEMYITRRAAGRVVADEEDRILTRIAEIDRVDPARSNSGGSMYLRILPPVLEVERAALEACLRRLRDVRSRLECLVE